MQQSPSLGQLSGQLPPWSGQLAEESSQLDLSGWLSASIGGQRVYAILLGSSQLAMRDLHVQKSAYGNTKLLR